MNQPLHDLIEIIHFTENVSTRIHGLLDEAEIYRVVRDEFAQSRRYTACILLLTEDKSKLRVAEVSAPQKRVKAAENATGLQIGEYRIDLDQPSVYSQVVREGKTIHADVSDITSELFPHPRAHAILNSLGYGRKMTVLTPLKKHGEVIGILAMSAPDLVEHFVPSVKNLARHISTALELADEHDERRRAEQQLRQTEKCYRELYESSIDGIVTSDLEGRITGCNQAYAAMLGYSREELRSLTDTELMPPEWLMPNEGILREVMDRGYSYEFEREYARKDGVVFPVSVRTWRINDEAGHPTSTCSIVRDITERKRAEAELAQHRQHLEDLVEQRTAELALATAQLEALRQLGLELTARLDLDDLLHSIASQAITLLGGTAGGLDIYLPGRDALEWTGTVGTDWKPTADILQRGEGVAGKVWETGQPLIVDDYQHWEGRATAWETCSLASIVSVPIRCGEEFLGVLNVSSDSPGAFSPADAELLSLFATQAAIAMRNARLYRAEHKRVTQLTVVNQVARKAISILDLEQLLQEIVVAIQQGFGYHNVALFLLDDTANELEMRAIAGGFKDLVSPDYHQAVEAGMLGWTAKTGRPLLANDVSQEPRYIPGFIDRVPTQSELCVPLRLAGQVIGALDVQDTQMDVFDESDLTAMETLADQVAVAIKNTQLVASLAQDKDRLELLHRLSRRISESLDIHDVAQRALDDVCAVVGAGHGVVLVQEIGTDRLRLVAVFGYDAESINAMDQRIHLRVGDGLTGWVAAHHVPVIVPDVTKDERWMVVKGMDDWVLSAMSVPLVSRDELQGVLSIYSEQEGFFNDDHRRLVESAVATVTAAIANARLYEAEWNRRQEAETLREAALTLTTTLDRDKVIERILAQLQEVVPYDTASVQLLRQDHLEIVGGRGFPNLPDLLGTAFPIGEDNPNTEVVRTQAPFIVDDAPAVYTGFGESPHLYANVRSWLGVPMVVNERLVGMIALDKCEPGFYTQKHARLAEAFAAQAAIAIANSRLFQAERRQRELAEALERAAAAVGSTLDLDQVLDLIMEQVERVVLGDTFNVMLIGDDTASVVRRRGYECLGANDPLPGPPVPITGYPSLMKMAQTGKPVVVQDTITEPDWVPGESRGWRRSYVGAPIQVGKVTVGFLNVSGTQPGQFSAADAHRLESFARHAATAIENARLYQELHAYAESLEERVQERTAEIQAQYARLDAILRSATDGIVVTDATGEILQANPVARTWLTRTLSPEDATRLREAVQVIAQQASAVPTPGQQPEIVLELPSLDLELKAAPIPEPSGGEAAVVVVVHDITHLKVLDRMKTHFVSNVSHELRTPVTTIKLYAHLLQRTSPDDEKWQAYLTALAQEANRQAQLVEDILQISRIDAGRLELRPRPIPLNELAARAIDSHQTLARERGLTLEHHPVEPGPMTLVDPERTMQVLNNLVENAIHYTPPGGAVAISTGQAEADGRAWATMSVTDTGIGIPEDELPHVFERFFRGKGPRVMQVSGTGLGLSIAREIVELHGGHVTVETRTGKGTTFTLWLPLVV